VIDYFCTHSSHLWTVPPSPMDHCDARKLTRDQRESIIFNQVRK
jgi:hypothetical protein